MKKVLFALIACVLCAGMVGGAFAYFTDVETSTGNVLQAGTLNMQIQDNDEGPFDSPVIASFKSPTGFAPGQTFTTDPVTFRNVGSIDIPFIFAKFDITNETHANIAKQFKLVSYGEKSSTVGWDAADDESLDADGYWVESFGPANAWAYLDFWGLDTDGFTGNEYITLYDLEAGTPAGSSTKTGMWFFDNGSPTNLALPVGGWAQLRFTFEFLPTATNEFQGDAATFDVYFVGAQTSTDLDLSITDY
jgi:predicted ribosomally synthesized peptide with SipW-like signal peptide